MATYYSASDDISFVPLTRVEEKSLFTRFYASTAKTPSEDSLKARDEIIARHLKLVAKLSLFYAKGSLRDDDAISAGNFGLVQALESRCFDQERGTLFSSYVRAYVRGQVLAALREKGWKGAGTQEEESSEYAPEATVTGHDGGEDTCHRRGLAVVAFPSRRLCKRAVETVDHAGEEQQLGTFRRESIAAALSKLPELEATTIRSHFFGDQNFADIGRTRGLTREGIRKAFNRGMAKMKEILAEGQEELL